MTYQSASSKVGKHRSATLPVQNPTEPLRGRSERPESIFAALKRLSRHFAVVHRIWKRIQADDCFDLAAQTSFYFSLSLLPFCLVLAIVVGWLPSTALWKSFATWVVAYLPRDSQRLMFSTILGLAEYSPGFLSFGLIAALWSASAGFVSLMESLSAAYGVRDRRPFWLKYIAAICVTILAMVYILLAFAMAAFGRWGFHWSSGQMGLWLSHRAWEAGRWIADLVEICFAVDFLNYVLPASKRRWHWLTPGTTFAVLTLVLGSALFNVYIQNFSSYPRIYGAIGGFIILMLWIYIASLIVLIGAVTDHEIETSASSAGAA